MRRARTQVVTVCSRTSSSRPPEAICDASDDVATRAIVVARTEKVEKSIIKAIGRSIRAVMVCTGRITNLLNVNSEDSLSSEARLENPVFLKN